MKYTCSRCLKPKLGFLSWYVVVLCLCTMHWDEM